MINILERNMFFQFLILTICMAVIMSLSCQGANPPFAPFGSEVTMLDPPDDISISPNDIEPFEVQAIVLNPDGEPLNNVRVIWSLSFAGENSLVQDTNGDGVADSRKLQLVNPRACPQNCLLEPISTWFAFGAFVDSPFPTLTDDRGISKIIILITNPNGDFIADPAVLQASTDSGSVDVVEFSVNVP